MLRSGTHVSNSSCILMLLGCCFRICYYRPQRSWAKVMFLQASVILSTGGEVVCLSACWDGIPPRSRHPPLGPDPPRIRHPPRSRHPPGSRCQHTVNERPVRILLECILVCLFCPRRSGVFQTYCFLVRAPTHCFWNTWTIERRISSSKKIRSLFKLY